jgi:hypothetical protein
MGLSVAATIRVGKSKRSGEITNNCSCFSIFLLAAIWQICLLR